MTNEQPQIDPDCTSAEQAFLESFPSYVQTAILDELRQTEYSRLDNANHVYLDYTGGGLYAQSQLDAHFAMLRDGVWGNPHSQNPTSLAMTEQVEQARDYVLQFFNADPEEYDVVFTSNASGALKLVGESYPFGEGGRYLALYDNHNSVNGIREFARSKGAHVDYVPTELPDMRIPSNLLETQLNHVDASKCNLFAFPAQSNYTGVQHDLEWIAYAQARGWHVLLDAAAFVPSNQLDLSVYQPDFVSMSFYKMFGYPTGIGALICRKSAMRQLKRPWFAGGTITIVSVQSPEWYYLIDGHPSFEEGTVNYLSIPAVEIGLRHLDSIGMEIIHERVTCLTSWLLEQMCSLQHDNGQPLIHIHGPVDSANRGGTISFHMNDPEGKRLDYRRVEKLANEARISLRTGCFCNPGSGEITYQFTKEEMGKAFSFDEPVSFDEFYEMATHDYHKHPSAIRVSVGLATNFADVFALINFFKGFQNRPAEEINALPIGERPIPDTA